MVLEKHETKNFEKIQHFFNDKRMTLYVNYSNLCVHNTL